MKRALILLVALAWAALSGNAARAANEDLHITIPANALFFLPLYVASDKGFFKDVGIEMETIITQGDGPDIDALISGSVQFTISTPNRLMTAYQQGKPLLGVMQIMNRIGIQCFIGKDTAERVGFRPDLPIADRLSKLKGLTIAGTRPGAFTYLLGIDYLKRAHLTPQVDAKVIGIGTAAGMIAAVENGGADVGCFGSPVIETAVARGTSLPFINNTQGEDDTFKDFLFELVYVMPDYAKRNPDTVRKVLAALVRANVWIATSGLDEVAGVARKHFTGLDDDVLMASIGSLRPAFSQDPRMTNDAFAAAAEFLRRTDTLKGDVPFAKVTDNSYLPE